ncbi:MAG: VC0807 family protein [Solirubrobacteraceae bacterium]
MAGRERAGAQRPRNASGQLLRFVIDIGGPIALYYWLHGLGASNLLALSAGAVIPVCSASFGLLTARRADPVALLVLATIAASILASVIAHNARFLLAKEGVLTGVWGAWFIASVRARRPAAFVFARPLMEHRRVFGTSNWDALWDQQPAFRQIWRTSSVIWGAAMLLDAVTRVAIAYTLPIHTVPAIGGALWPVTLIVIQIVTNVYYHRAGLYQILGASWLDRTTASSHPADA